MKYFRFTVFVSVWKNHKESHITASNVRCKSNVNCNCFWRADPPTRAGKLKIIHIKAWQTTRVEVRYKHPAIPTPNIWTQGRCLPAWKKELLSLLKKCLRIQSFHRLSHLMHFMKLSFFLLYYKPNIWSNVWNWKISNQSEFACGLTSARLQHQHTVGMFRSAII